MEFTQDFGEFRPWSDAVAVFDRINDEDKMFELERHLEDVFSGHTPSATEINDYLWHDSDSVYKALDMKPDDPDTHDIDEIATEWCLSNDKTFLYANLNDDNDVEIHYTDENGTDDKVEIISDSDIAELFGNDNCEYNADKEHFELW